MTEQQEPASPFRAACVRYAAGVDEVSRVTFQLGSAEDRVADLRMELARVSSERDAALSVLGDMYDGGAVMSGTHCLRCGHGWAFHDFRDPRDPSVPCCEKYAGMGENCGCVELPPRAAVDALAEITETLGLYAAQDVEVTADAEAVAEWLRPTVEHCACHGLVGHRVVLAPEMPVSARVQRLLDSTDDTEDTGSWQFKAAPAALVAQEPPAPIEDGWPGDEFSGCAVTLDGKWMMLAHPECVTHRGVHIDEPFIGNCVEQAAPTEPCGPPCCPPAPGSAQEPADPPHRQVSKIIAKHWLFGENVKSRDAATSFDAAAHEILTLLRGQS